MKTFPTLKVSLCFIYQLRWERQKILCVGEQITFKLKFWTACALGTYG